MHWERGRASGGELPGQGGGGWLLCYNLITLPCYDAGMGWMQENCNIINVTQIAASRCQAATSTGDSVTFAKSVMEIILPQNPIVILDFGHCKLYFRVKLRDCQE